jgi:hypothetical protein
LRPFALRPKPFHQLRHDGASLLFAASIYGHLATEVQHEAADRMDEVLGGLHKTS